MKGWRLTRNQIDEARRLRFEQKLSWRNISRALGCDAETVQRAIDPDYDKHKRAVYERRKVEMAKLREAAAERAETRKLRRGLIKPAAVPGDPPADQEDFIARRNALKSDAAFCAAMRHAIRRREESASDGIVTTPSTERVRFVTGYRDPFAGMSSPAGMCADS